MNRGLSPFAALTGAEKQLKWLEYQSIRLPYVQGSVDALGEVTAEPSPPPKPRQPAQATENRETPQRQMQKATPPESASPKNAGKPEPRLPAEAVHIRRSASGGPALSVPAPSPIDFQKVRHRQYDTVIARMKQAELRAKQYEPLGQVP